MENKVETVEYLSGAILEGKGQQKRMTLLIVKHYPCLGTLISISTTQQHYFHTKIRIQCGSTQKHNWTRRQRLSSLGKTLKVLGVSE